MASSWFGEMLSQKLRWKVVEDTKSVSGLKHTYTHAEREGKGKYMTKLRNSCEKWCLVGRFLSFFF